MPSVGMRRTTRVFGARVLRSGRRLWSEPGGGKYMRGAVSVSDSEEWIELLDNSGDGAGGNGDDAIVCKENGWRHGVDLTQEVAAIDIDRKSAESKSPENAKNCLNGHNCGTDRMWGTVYKRKRQKSDSESSNFDGGYRKKRALMDTRCGKQFVRKKWRTKEVVVNSPFPEAESCNFLGSSRCRVLAAVIESCSRSSTHWVACLLNLVLRYMAKAMVRLHKLSAFMLSKPLAQVFSTYGIHFSWDSSLMRSSGICKFFEARYYIPLFAVDFSVVPSCFINLHSSMLLRSACFPHFVAYSSERDDSISEVLDVMPCTSSKSDSGGIENLTFGSDGTGKKKILASVAPKSSSRAVQPRNGVNSRSNIRKRRSSFMSKRAKNTLVFGARRASGVLVSNFFRSRQVCIPLASISPNHEPRSSVWRKSSSNIKDLKSSLLELSQDTDSTSCSANILVVEPDKCYRIEDAVIKLEMSASKQRLLAVRKDGALRCSLTAHKAMRPCSNNRVTHDIIWTEDNNSWKLEFPDRRDWFIFKELYRECSERNVVAPAVSAIPVPGVYEVASYIDSENVLFVRPEYYITMKDDELSRALVKKTAIYDMDLEDDEWLDRFNNVSSVNSELHKPLSQHCFELIIDALEKTFYCNPDDSFDEKPPADLCLDLGSKEVVEAVYNYCMRKRKQKRSALIKVYQCYQPRRAQLLPKAILRKKRSFKRQPSHSGRVKQQFFLQAEQDALEEQNALRKVQETKAAASKSEELAILKRQRAQILMENADLATYKAMMSVRIAEAARIADSADAAATFFLN